MFENVEVKSAINISILIVQLYCKVDLYEFIYWLIEFTFINIFFISRENISCNIRLIFSSNNNHNKMYNTKK